MQIFDSHFHIIDHQYPLQTNDSFIPENFLVEDYQHLMQSEQLIGGTIVSGSFQGFDHTYIKPALERLGHSYVAVIQAPSDINEEQIAELDKAGVKGVRFNLYRGNQTSAKEINELAHKIYICAGWHAEFYLDSGQLNELSDVLVQLPSVSIDHLGLSKTGLNNTLLLAENGIKVKASGFGRVDFEIIPALKRIHSTNPDALMFGSDLPSTRAPRKFTLQDLEIIRDNFSVNDAKKILCENALTFYRIRLS